MVHGLWDDVSLKMLEDRLEALIPREEGMFGKLLSRKSSDEAPVDLDVAVDAYVRKCLLLDEDEVRDSEEPQVLE